MFARVMSTSIKKEVMDEAIAEWRTHIEPFKATGLQKGYMLVDRSTGKYLSITIWDSEEAQRRNSTSAGQVKGRQAMTDKYFTAAPTPSTFEVVSVVE
jgi:heme-degrading monooxygenase HmoA